MHLLENVFTSKHGEAITVLQLLTKFKTVLSEIDTYLNEYGNRLNSIELKNFDQDNDLLVLKSQVATLQTKVNSIQLTLGDYLLQLHQLDILTQTHSTQITDIQNVNQSQGTQLINLNTK